MSKLPSTKEEVCPLCGRPLPKDPNTLAELKWYVYAILLAIAALAGVVSLMLGLTP